MAKTLNLYNHNVDPIGTATFNKARNGYDIVFNSNVHYGDVFIRLEKFEEYKVNMGFNSMSGKQVTLEDLL